MNALAQFVMVLAVFAFVAAFISSVVTAFYLIRAADFSSPVRLTRRERWARVPEKVRRFHIFAICAFVGCIILSAVLRK